MLGLKTLEEIESSYLGKIKVVHSLWGISIQVDGVSQSGFLVSKIWKQALSYLHKNGYLPLRVLILGLGAGSSALLVSDFWKDAEIVGIDIEPKMVWLGRKYLGLDKVKNLKFVREDAGKWVRKNHKKFDLVLVDLYKGGQMPKEFRTKEFVRYVKNQVAKDGIVIFNHLYSSAEKKDADGLYEILKDEFLGVRMLHPEANILFVCYT